MRVITSKKTAPFLTACLLVMGLIIRSGRGLWVVSSEIRMSSEE